MNPLRPMPHTRTRKYEWCDLSLLSLLPLAMPLSVLARLRFCSDTVISIRHFGSRRCVVGFKGGGFGGPPAPGSIDFVVPTTSLALRHSPALREDALAVQAILQISKLEDSIFLQTFERHWVTPLVRAWNRLQAELYAYIRLVFSRWHGATQLSLAGIVVETDDEEMRD